MSEPTTVTTLCLCPTNVVVVTTHEARGVRCRVTVQIEPTDSVPMSCVEKIQATAVLNGDGLARRIVQAFGKEKAR
jgi:hypothetical protein